MATNWRIYKNDTVAAKLDRCDLPGFFDKKVVVGLNEAALVLRDGHPQELLTEANVQVADVFDQLKSQFGIGADISVYFVDLAPFDSTIFLGEQNTASVNTQVAVISQVETQAKLHEGIQPDDSAERKGWWLRKAVEKASRRIGWLQEEEPRGLEQQEQAPASVASQCDVSQISIVAVSTDRELISASCVFRLRVDPTKAENFMGLLKGKRGLATWDIAALIRDEFLAKVLVPEIARHHSSCLRGNRNLLVELETETRTALIATLNTFGLLMDNFVINWGLTEQERMEISRKRAVREGQALQFAKHRRIAQLIRLREIEKTRIANLQELKIAQVTGNEEHKTLLLASELKRNLLIKDNKVNSAQVDARIREIGLEVEKRESQAGLEQRKTAEELRLDLEDKQFKQKHAIRLASIEASDKEMWSMVKMQIEMATQKHDREIPRRRVEIEAEFRKMEADIEDRFQQRKLKLDESMARMGMMERLVSQGLSTGQADANVLHTMLHQATEQEYATTSVEKVQARSGAQAAGQNLEMFRAAQADERTHQRHMTGLAADMMDAAKQSPAPVIVPGAALNPVSVMSGQPMVFNNPKPPPVAKNAYCPSCYRAVESEMKYCPFCGKSFAERVS